MFFFPNKKLSEKIAPLIIKELEKGRYNKNEDPVYQAHVKKVRKIKRKHFWWF